MPPSTDELTADDIRTARFHMILSALATGLTVLALYLGSELAGGRPPAPDGRSCTPGTESEVCEEDESCVDHQCQRSPLPLPALPCQEGDPCGECTCDGPSSCDPADNRCHARRPEVCSPEVVRLLTDLRRFEQEKCQGVGTGAATCAPKDLRNFFIEHQQFNELLLELKNGATVLFDRSQPVAGLPGAQAAYYEAEFASLADRLKQARHILIIGRASQDRANHLQANNPRANNQSYDYVLAQARITEVQQWISQLERTAQGQDEMRKKFITLAIGTASPLEAARLTDRPRHNFIAWRAQATLEVRSALHDLANLDAERARQLQLRLNRSVFIVPVPCEIPEAPANRDAQP